MSPRQNIEALAPILELQPVVPVVQIEDEADAAPLARALVAGGLRVIEVTLRSERASAAIASIAREVPQAIVGAGTVLHRDHYKQAVEMGARFIVSPGTNASLYGAAYEFGVPLLPGVMTPSDIVEALNRGYHYLKFFPAEQAGGMAFLKALRGPFPNATFCPTGGISAKTASQWLALPNVICVGGSWLAPQDLIRAKNWPAISQLAADAMQMR